MYPVFDKKSRKLVMPINVRRDDVDDALRRASQLRLRVLREFTMPFNFVCHRFYHVVVPKTLTWLEDEDGDDFGTFTFIDAKRRYRMRVIVGELGFQTHFVTRYRPDWFRMNRMKNQVAFVGDLDVSIDEIDSDDPKIVWEGKKSDCTIEPAEKWLGKHKPDWRNPAAYWSK